MKRNLFVLFTAFAGFLGLASPAVAESPAPESAMLSNLSAADDAPLSKAADALEFRPATINIAQHVGSVTVDQAAQLSGETRYADRRADGGTNTIRFVASRPLSASAGALPAGMPIAGRLTSSFGMRTHPLHGGTRWHAGVDLAAPAGTPVRATSDGVVTSAGRAGGYGLLVELTHANDVSTRYAHLQYIAVSIGQTVRRGDVVGRVGSTGSSTGPHVHYEVRAADRPIDPCSARADCTAAF